MIKRAAEVKTEKTITEESAFKVGSLVKFYLEGERYTKVVDTNVDDDGDLCVKLSMPFGRTKFMWFKTDEIELMPEKETT